MSRVRIAVVAVAIALALSISMLVYSYTSLNRAGEESEDYIVVEDFYGRTVRVPRDVKRVVALGPGMLRLVSYLGALDLVVGVEEAEHMWSATGRDYAMAYGERFKSLPVVGSGGPRNPPDPEKVRAVRPDLVIMSLGYTRLYDPDRLSEEVGAPVVVVDYGLAGHVELEPVKRALKLLGKVLGREERAEMLCEFIDLAASDLSSRTRNLSDRPTVYVGAVSYAGKRPFTASQAGFPPLLLLNTRSIADDVGQSVGFVELDFEYIIHRQPNVVFIDLNNLDVVLDDFRRDPAKYCALRAFKEGRVYAILPFNYYHTNVATALADAYYMGKVLYPERFSDVDPVAKANEIFRVFLDRELYDMFVEGLGRGFGPLSALFSCG